MNTSRDLAKSYGDRLRGCNVRNLNPKNAEDLSPKLQRALQPLLAAIESLSRRIREYNKRMEAGPRELSTGGAAEAGQGLGTLIALTFLLTLEDAHRFRKSRDVGWYLGLQPGRANRRCTSASKAIRICERSWCKGRSAPTAICSAGACDGAERGGRSGKQRAVIAVALQFASNIAVLSAVLSLDGETAVGP